MHRPHISFAEQHLPSHKTHLAPHCPGRDIPTSHPVQHPAGTLSVSLAAHDSSEKCSALSTEGRRTEPPPASRRKTAPADPVEQPLRFPAHTWNECHGQPPSWATSRPGAALHSWGSLGRLGEPGGRWPPPWAGVLGLGWGETQATPPGPHKHVPRWLGAEGRRGVIPQHAYGASEFNVLSVLASPPNQPIDSCCHPAARLAAQVCAVS